ncbi:MAG: 6-carboxytetrahydropterin synthase QueD [Bradyrhizobiaceae bacterium]|nr:MAG: 6-carboxytetrahydropterin synthase QueD [Bradyrhizobiaceae bacterium]
MKISQAFRFEAAHRLPNVSPAHRCHRMHGHSYRIEVVLNGSTDPHTGFVVDFFDVEEAFEPLLKRLDHNCLNDVPGLENPTAENIAIWIWEKAKQRLPQLSSVRVYETPDCWAEYDGLDPIV